MNRPIILLTADIEKTSSESRHHLNTTYTKAIATSGGLPLVVPILHGLIERYLDIADGVVVTGSAPGVLVSRERKDFHTEMVVGSLERKIPLLGICHGMQLIGECLGGTLVRDDHQLRSDESMHMPSNTASELAHEVMLEPGSILSRLSPDAQKIEVNSLHRCALKENGHYTIAARAMDGVVEAIESIGGAFCMGLQWHPEYLLTNLDKAIFKHFIHASSSMDRTDFIQ